MRARAHRRDPALRGDGRARARPAAASRRDGVLSRARARGRGRRVIHMEIGEPDFTARRRWSRRRARAARRPQRLHRHAGPAGAARGDCRALRSAFRQKLPRQNRDHLRRIGRPAADAGAVRRIPATKSWCPTRATPATATWCAPSKASRARCKLSRRRPTSSRRWRWCARPGAAAPAGLLLGSPSNPTGTAHRRNGTAKKSRASSLRAAAC